MVTRKRLIEVFSYNRHTGVFTRKSNGKTTHHQTSAGYIKISVDNKSIFAHQAAWLYEYDEFPPKHIDHINHVKSDNRIVNLRLVSQADNAKNMKRNKNNKTGVVGVSWSEKRRKWHAEITVDMNSIKLGSFEVFEDALEARREAELFYNFHSLHGENNPDYLYISKMQSLVSYAKVGEHKKIGVIQMTKDGDIIAEYTSAKEAEEMTDTCRSHIGNVCKGKRKTAGGFAWKYA